MVFCPNCGSSFNDGTKFCSKCGAKLPAQPAAEQAPAAEPVIQAEPIVRQAKKEKKEAPKLNLNPKLIAIAAAALVAVILLITFIPKIFSGGGSITMRKDYVRAGIIDDELIGFGKSGKVVKMDFDNTLEDGGMSADGSKLLMVDSEGIMYIFDGSKFNKIAEGVKKYLLSFDGTGVAYTDEDNALYLYNGGKAKKIAEDIKTLNVISPDGKAVGYTKESNDTVRGYFYDGKERELGKNMTPYALSAKGTYVYYKNKDGVLYVQKGENSDDRQKIGDSIDYAILNADGTQILANVKTDDGTRTYFSAKGGERQEVSKTALKILLPGRAMKDSRFAGVKDLKSQLYYTYNSSDGYAVYKLNSKLETSSCVKNAFSLTLQEDGKTITYLKNDKLYLMNTSASSPEGKQLAAEVDSYLSSVDGKLFLYENEEKETFTVNTSGKSQKVIGESVSEWAAVGSGFVYIIDEELYFTSGGKGSKVSGFSDEAKDLMGYRDYVLIQGEDEATYMTKDGKKIIKIAESK
jgi:hypothetical protein